VPAVRAGFGGVPPRPSTQALNHGFRGGPGRRLRPVGTRSLSAPVICGHHAPLPRPAQDQLVRLVLASIEITLRQLAGRLTATSAVTTVTRDPARPHRVLQEVAGRPPGLSQEYASVEDPDWDAHGTPVGVLHGARMGLSRCTASAGVSSRPSNQGQAAAKFLDDAATAKFMATLQLPDPWRRTVADQYFTVTQKVEALYQPHRPHDLAAYEEPAAMREAPSRAPTTDTRQRLLHTTSRHRLPLRDDLRILHLLPHRDQAPTHASNPTRQQGQTGRQKVYDRLLQQLDQTSA
jgi:hypothetical protein